MKKPPLPTFQTDEEAERFVDEADLSDYDLSGFGPARLVLRTPEGHERVGALVSDATFHRAVVQAQEKGTTLDRFLGDIIERALEPSA